MRARIGPIPTTPMTTSRTRTSRTRTSRTRTSPTRTSPTTTSPTTTRGTRGGKPGNMTVELRPLGVQCNLQCHYCYQHPQRDAGLPARAYDMERMKAGLLAEGRPFNLFGGEPLLVPKEDLEEIWKWGLEHFGRNKVQTNATLIDDDHIRMFRDYRVHVGVSIDGPGPLNDARWFGTLARTRAATAKTEAALA